MEQLLFEDNAEFGFGYRLTIDKFNEYALELLDKLATCDCKGCKESRGLMAEIKAATQNTQEEIVIQRGRVAKLKVSLAQCPDDDSRTSSPSPIIWLRNRSGSMVATVGLMISATAVSTMSSLPVRTLTFSSSTPRFIPIPVARLPRRLRSVLWRSSPPAASVCRRKTSV